MEPCKVQANDEAQGGRTNHLRAGEEWKGNGPDCRPDLERVEEFWSGGHNQ